MSIFPKEMLAADMTLEGIASKLTLFQLQLQLCHWQTTSYAEHKATDGLYDYITSFKDGVIEKLMGYSNRRIKLFTLSPLTIETSTNIVNAIISFAANLEMWAGTNKYCDIENLAQELSGEAAKCKYLLTLS